VSSEAGKGMSGPKSASPTGRNEHNRLIFEKSRYLLQHAGNPVDWYPWGEEAFLKAEKEERPVFLSIGYSACHWCQVMERESFEDAGIAQLMNRHFVAIKVDREERPDIDNIYMSVCQSMTGSGGWPLTIVMTPDKKPFFAGTYFPPRSRLGRPGLVEILSHISTLWQEERPRLLQIGTQVTEAIRQISCSSAYDHLKLDNLRVAARLFQNQFDELHGGFGAAPKFPSGHNLSFLLRWWKRSGEQSILSMVEKTLDHMWRGGIYDHLGFGFHRYSTDDEWLIPHFEKMLYDQAMLAIAYIEAYQATGKNRYAVVAQQIFTYVLTNMTSPEGGFYSSLNAESEGEEGKFYVWTRDEIKASLGDQQGKLFCRFWGVTEEGNAGQGRSVLHVRRAPEEFAGDEGMSAREFEESMERFRQRLFRVREQRIHPSKDDKILTDWNGLMITALAKGSQALRKPEYADAARRAADFALQSLRRRDGRLLHRYRDGEANLRGYVDDYAFFIWGLIELYETTFKVSYLKEALSLTDEMLTLFWDDREGGLYFTGSDSEELLVRMKESHDGALPSGNSVAALNLLRLGRMTATQELERKANGLMEAFGGSISHSPTGFSQLLVALDFALGPTKEIVIAGDRDDEDTKHMLRSIGSRFVPRKVLLLHPEGKEGKATERIAPFMKEQKKIGGKTTAYVCENHFCRLPTTDVTQMVALIESAPGDESDSATSLDGALPDR